MSYLSADSFPPSRSWRKTRVWSSSTMLLILSLILMVAVDAKFSPAAAESPGQPAVLVLLMGAPDKVWEPFMADLKFQDHYLIGYRGIAMLDRNTEHPILVTQGFNLKLNRLVKIYLNWDQIAGFQIVDPSLAF